MSILLDNCVPRRYLRLLRQWGYNAHPSNVYIPEDAEDKNVIALAVQHDAVLLTVDMDFANILEYPPASYQGIIVMRYQTHDEADLDVSLKTTLAASTARNYVNRSSSFRQNVIASGGKQLTLTEIYSTIVPS